MKQKQFAVLIIASLLLVLTSCSMPSGAQATPTPASNDMASGVLLMLQRQMEMQVTQQAIDADRIETGAKMTATQLVVAAEETFTEKQHQQELAAQIAASTQQAWSVTVEAAKTKDAGTQEASGTGTAQAMIGLTATIAAKQTDVSNEQTQQAPIIAAKNKEVQAQADSVALAAERERMMNGVIAWGPWVITAVAMLAAIYFGWKYFQVRIFKADERGDAPYLLIGNQIIDLDGLPGPLLNLATQQAPLLTSPDNAERIKARDQFIDLNTRGLPNQFQERKPTGQMAMPGASSAKVEISAYDDVQKLLGGAEEQLNNEELQ